MKLDPREARHILRQCDFAALATHSAKLPGYPFISHVPLALDGAGRPLMLLSSLAEHTRNLAADPHASLMVALPGEETQDGPQAQPRLTLVGELRPAEVDASSRERYLRYHPDAATYLGFGDFRFYRLEVQAVRLVAGFARAGWIAPAEWAGRPLAEGEEARLVERIQNRAPSASLILGVDWEGMDACVPAGSRRRFIWKHEPATLQDLETVAIAALGRP